jgi:hypothetical protein
MAPTPRRLSLCDESSLNCRPEGSGGGSKNATYRLALDYGATHSGLLIGSPVLL